PLLSFYCLMIPHTQRSPLFPYTTLFRSQWLPEESGDNDPATVQSEQSLELAHGLAHDIAQLLVDDESSDGWLASCDVEGSGEARSEEHTSELQSHLNLVCRLLLEKKK